MESIRPLPVDLYAVDPAMVPDLAIVSTCSRERLEAAKSLIKNGCKAMILEKVLFPRLEDYDEMEHLIKDYNVKAWVNCPLWRDKTIRGPITYVVEGNNWGLASNLIHHLHEFIAMSGDDNITIDMCGLETKIEQAKRSSYIELFGVVSAWNNHSKFTAICRRGEKNKRKTKIAHDNGIVVFDEFPLQSQLTAHYVTKFIAGLEPDLPNYASSARLHRIMIAGFLDHLRKIDPAIMECAIT